ncbi:helicase competence protein [Carnobacterium sp. 17-4]|uniref:DEAD/DEAH box helicase n=1 Tax=Carnobacterium sp. (strain 17-4) TaxID=208596 RepID=UPI0002058E8F|nr:DEAD/DEAH box helicase family protein [Carnobacterium sp. 17-4]AEB29079.1 helicase competence protein [Carnobacterium sp. 17-4]
MDHFLMGRELLMSELKEDFLKEFKGITSKGFMEVGQQLTCRRCGSNQPKDRQAAPCTCGKNCFYCIRCLQMGKVKRCNTLYHAPEKNQFILIKEPILTWKGQLSQQQERASKEIETTIKTGQTRLIWAVAGAGKTEMLFKGIEWAIKSGKRVCIASPRTDVCLELTPRLKSAFQPVEQITLYGEMEEGYRYTQLVIATTHQLLRFREAFDVLIIDEIDAFPFNTDKALQFAAQKAKKTTGTIIYLSATPNKQMRQDIVQKKLAASVLPARYHGFALPEPKAIWVGDWRKSIMKRKKKAVIFKEIQRLLQAKRRFLVFVPNIELMLEFSRCLAEFFPDCSFTSVSSEDEQRKKKVQKMRDENYQFMLTTTILERGVTFRDIDVLVLGAEDRTFTEAALIQIAGRVGRHRDFPIGEVRYLHYGQTKALKNAISQIKKMNHLARERGLLIGK